MVDRLLLLVGYLEFVDRALQLFAGGVELALELFVPREVIGRLDRAARPRPPVGFFEKTDQQQLFAFALHRMDFDANRDGTAAVAHLCACSDRQCMFPARLLYRCPELVAQTLAGHGEQLAAGLARSHPQIAVGRPRVIEAFVLAVDQDRSGRIGLEQQPVREVANTDAVRRRRARPTRPKRLCAPSRADRKIDFSRPTAANLPIDPLLLGDRFEPVGKVAHRLGFAEHQSAAFAEREME